METKKDYHSDRIELRSEKVQKLIGTIPPILVYSGIAVITIIFVMLILTMLLIPYPYGAGESIFQHLFF